MHKIKNSVRIGLIYAAVVLLAGGQPMVAMAETVESTAPVVQEEAASTSTPPVEEERTYTYNPDTQRWDSDKWAYNPTTGTYEAVVVPHVVEEQPAATAPEADPSTSSATINSDTNAIIDNTLNSNATTGNATINSNTNAGSATTGRQS